MIFNGKAPSTTSKSSWTKYLLIGLVVAVVGVIIYFVVIKVK